MGAEPAAAIDVIETREVTPTTDVVRATPAPLEHTYRPSLVLAPADAHQLVQSIKDLQRSVLVKGVDYDRIPGMKADAAPVLLKPGAERLLQVFGLGHRVERGEVDPDPDGGHWGVWYRCTVTKVLLDGREVDLSSCEGYASYDETKFWDGIYEGKGQNRRKTGQKKSPWNTVIKMAQKRAMVGATLTATATSGLFTQDMEDYYHEHPSEAAEEVAAANERTTRDAQMRAWVESLTVDRFAKWEAWKSAHDKWWLAEETLGEAWEILRDLAIEEASASGAEPFGLSEEDVAPATPPTGDGGTSPMAPRNKLTQLQILCNAIPDLKDRPTRLAWAAGHIGRELKSFNQLTLAECELLIGVAKAEPDDGGAP